MTKRILSILLISALVFSYGFFAFAEEKKEETASVLTENMKILNSLGIADFTDSDASERITRGEFAAMAGRILGYIPKTSDSAMMTARDCMVVLSNINIIRGYSDGEFRENNPIKYDEALVIAVTGLGYGPIALSKGGYPYGYRIAASEKKLLKNIQLEEGYLTGSQAADLCMNMLTVEYLKFDGIEDGEVRYVMSGGRCLMEDIFGASFKRGVVDGVDLTRLAGDNDVAPGYISVDGLLIKAEDKNLYNALGYYCEVYYEEDDNGVPKLLHLEKSEKNKERTVEISDVIAIDETSVSFEKEDGYKNKYSTEKYRYIILNGASTEEKLSLSLIEGKEGILRLLDNDGDGAAEVVFIESCVDYVVAAKDESKSRIYDKRKSGSYIDLDTETNDPYVEIFDSNGKEMSFSSISVGNVVSVYESSDDAPQKYIRAYVSSVVASGTVEGFEAEEGIIKVSGVEYRLTEKCLEMQGADISAGDSIEVYVNYSGEIAYFNNLSSGSTFGYLVHANAKSSGPDSTMLFKIYHKDSEGYSFNTYEAAKYYEIDDVRYQNGITEDVKKSLRALNNGSKLYYGEGIASSVVAQFISFEKDENGLIKRIDTAATGPEGIAADADMPDGNNTLYIDKVNNPYYDRSVDTDHAFLDVTGKVQPLKKSVPMYHFPYPSDGTEDYLNEEKYFVDTVNEALESVGVANGLTFIVRMKDSFQVDAVAVKFEEGAATKIKTHERLAAVNKVSSIIDDGVLVYQAEVYSQGRIEYIKAKTDYTFEGFTNEKDSSLKKTMTLGELKHGDLIRYKNGSDGFAGDVIFYYRPESDSFNSNKVSFKYMYSQTSVMHGYVMKRDSDGYWVACGETLEEALAVPSDKWVAVADYSGQSPMLYDFNGGTKARISTISINDMVAYEDAAEGCTEMIIHMYNVWPFGVYAIKR